MSVPPPVLDPAVVAGLPDPALDPPGFLTGAARHGDVVGYTVGGRQRVFVADPAVTHEVLTEWPEESRRTPITDIARETVGDGLVTTFSPQWRPRRLVVQRELSFRNVRRHTELFTRNTTEHLQRWRSEGRVDLDAALVHLALDNLGDAVFASDFRALRDSIGSALRTSQRAIDAVVEDRFDDALRDELDRAGADLDRIVATLVEQRTIEPTTGRDILAVLIEQAAGGDWAFRDPWLRDEVVTLVLAGHETTALTMAMALHLLATNPDVTDVLRGELEAAVERGVPEWALADEVPLCRHVIEETLRLFPPIPALHRTAVGDVDVLGYRIPAGTTVVVSPWVVQRDARWWPEPDRFDPWRFAGPRRTSLPRQAYLPFGAGPRICAGNHFALLESAVVVALATLRLRIEQAPGTRPALIDSGTALRCSEPLWADVRPADALATA